MALATILGGLLLLLGLIGCVVPVLPGPLCAYAALWVLVAFGAGPGMTPLAVGAAILVLATLADLCKTILMRAGYPPAIVQRGWTAEPSTQESVLH